MVVDASSDGASNLLELTGYMHVSQGLHAWSGCSVLTSLHGIVEPPAFRPHLSCPLS